MRKTASQILLILGIAAACSSCFFLIPSTIKISLVQQGSPEQNVTVTFSQSTADGFFHFKEWNGINIEDTVYNKRWIKSNDTVMITVPAGETSFLFDLTYEFNSQSSSRSYEFENIELKYLFEPGKKYEIKGRYKALSLGFKGIEFYLGLYDTTKKSTLLKEWMIGKS